MLHHPLVFKDSCGSRVSFGTGGSTSFIIQGLIWFRRIHIVIHPSFGLAWEDLCGSTSSQVWFGSRGSTWFYIQGLM